MSRIQAIDPSAAIGAVADQLTVTRHLLGSTPNLFATAANSVAAITSMNALFAALSKGNLAGKIGERVGLAIAQSNGCEYCLSAHTAIGQLHGIPASELAAARHGHSVDPKAQAAIAFALAVLDTKGRVSDSTIGEARAAGLSDGEIVEVVAHVALHVFANYLSNVAKTEVDFPLVPLDQVA